jgi:hypothetical protein
VRSGTPHGAGEDPSVDFRRAPAHDCFKTTGAREDVPTGVGTTDAGTYPGSILFIRTIGHRLGIAGGCSPSSIFLAILGVALGLFSSYRLRTTKRGRGGRGMAIAAVVIGLIAGVLSLVSAVGSQPA